MFKVNYLDGNMPTYTLNSSRGYAMMVAQHYNFIRFRMGRVVTFINKMIGVSDFIAEGLSELGQFELLSDRRMEPVVSVVFKGKRRLFYIRHIQQFASIWMDCARIHITSRRSINGDTTDCCEREF